MGWGLHGIYSTIGNLPLIPIFSEYNPQSEKLTFELYAIRNENYKSHEGKFSYRTYKTID